MRTGGDPSEQPAAQRVSQRHDQAHREADNEKRNRNRNIRADHSAAYDAVSNCAQSGSSKPVCRRMANRASVSTCFLRRPAAS